MFNKHRIEGGFTVLSQGHNSKDDILQPRLAQKNVIPQINTSSIIIGRSGSGKSILVSHLINQCYKGFFDLITIISPTAKSDDVQKTIKAQVVLTDIEKAPEFIQGLMNTQEKHIKKFGAELSPKVCIIFDDIMGFTSFLNSQEFTACFTRSRHYNLTIFCCSQKYVGLPKRCRLQANALFFFKAPDTESMAVVEDHTPPSWSKKKFLEVVKWATSEKYAFLFINMKCDFQERYRIGFDFMIDVSDTDKKNNNERSDTRAIDTSAEDPGGKGSKFTAQKP